MSIVIRDLERMLYIFATYFCNVMRKNVDRIIQPPITLLTIVVYIGKEFKRNAFAGFEYNMTRIVLAIGYLVGSHSCQKDGIYFARYLAA